MIGLLLGNWKLALAGVGILALMSVGTGLYVKGRLDASHKIEVAQLRADKLALEERIKLTNQLVKADAVQAVKDQDALESYQGQANELLNKLEDAERVCLTGNDTDSVRSLWRN